MRMLRPYISLFQPRGMGLVGKRAHQQGDVAAIRAHGVELGVAIFLSVRIIRAGNVRILPVKNDGLHEGCKKEIFKMQPNRQNLNNFSIFAGYIYKSKDLSFGHKYFVSVTGGTMIENKKGFWIWSGLLVGAAVLSLIGAIIGKTVIGFGLFGLGLAGVIVLFVLSIMKKDYFKNDRLKPLILGLVIGLLLASSVVLIVSGINTQVTTTSSRSQMNSRGMGGNSLTGLVSSSSNSGTTAKRAKILLGALFGVGGLTVVLINLVKFLKKKVSYSGDRGKVLLLGFILSVIIGISIPMMVTSTASASTSNNYSSSAMPNFPADMGTFPADFTPGMALATETETATSTPRPTAVASTPEPTNTATSVSLSTIVVCLNADVRVGLTIRDYPDETGNYVGSIPAGGCFTLDARAAGHEGWYRLATGQNGFGGIRIYADDTDTNLWVYAVDTDASEANLNGLTEIDVDTAVTPEATAN